MASLVRWARTTLVCVLSLGGGVVAAQGTGTISGVVVDSASRQPISNATVAVTGTRLGTLTREDGRYTLTGVPAGTQRVRVARIGFGAREREVTVAEGQAVTADFEIPTVATRLDEVVVTGYGTQRREAITGSVSTVDATEANVGVVANPNQLLQARVAGVQMTNNNGDPGAGMQIRVRGGTSISASNEPLYVVDGVPLQNENTVATARTVSDINSQLSRSPLNTINPSDIETITVLKDASATAIYGSRGANGVVLITTKRGASGRGGLEYETYVAASTAANKLDFVTGDQYRAFVQEQVPLYIADSLAGVPADERRGLSPSTLGNLGNASTDWEDALTRTGIATNHNLSFSGGSEATQYRASLNYFKQDGVVISSGLTRYQGRLNGQHQAMAGRLQLGLNLTASRVNNDYLAMENGGGFRGGIFTNMAIFNPTQPIHTTNDAGERVYYEFSRSGADVRNPVALAEQIQDEAPEDRILGDVSASFSLLPTLVARTTVGVDYTSAVRRTYFPRANPIGEELKGLARQADRSLQNVNFQQLLTYTGGIGMGEDHELEVVGGYEYTETDNQGFEIVAQGFVTDAFSWNNLGAASGQAIPPVSYRQESKLVSFFSRANYGYAGKYYLTAVVRHDGSSRLAEGNQWSTFPAFSASWRLSKEDFMAGRPLGLSMLAVRAGWGRQGNQAVRPYGTQLLLRADEGARYPFGGTVVQGLVAAQVANPDLKWETSEQVNIGLDFGFRDGLINGVIDFYNKETKDLLLDVSVPQPAVVSTRLENVGSLRNRGVELSLDAQLMSNQDMTLTSGIVASVDRSEVLTLGGERTFIVTGGVFGQGQSGRSAQRIMIGEPLGTFWGPRFLRVNDEGHQVFACESDRPECVNGETTTPSGDDDEIIGNANPDFALGLRSNLSWRRFDASWLWRAEVGRDVFNNTALVYGAKSNVTQGRNFLQSALDEGDALREPAIYSSRWIEDGSFVRLQNLTVGYTFDFPAGFTFGRSARIYVSGDNLLLFTPYSGYDPEVFTDAGLATRGIDYVNYPRPRSFTLGTRIQF